MQYSYADEMAQVTVFTNWMNPISYVGSLTTIYEFAAIFAVKQSCIDISNTDLTLFLRIREHSHKL